MRKVLVVTPTIVLMALLVFSLIQKNTGHAWVNLFAFSLTLLCVYSPVALFIEGIRNGMQTHKKLPLPEALLIWYLGIVSTFFVILAIYLMGHN
ncbi:LasU family protein [Companilactobacillus sp. HBUAS56275]|jgi:hypothetical protein|uniref:Uncharacterized protein n=1 Tax=Candidatus Companilactobacillus pullicola TaxID=2838523 RepID=A0A9D2CPQ3_9LACO|nr:hypothetical protein [Candidatus Companilactobacillus pullicola]